MAPRKPKDTETKPAAKAKPEAMPTLKAVEAPAPVPAVAPVRIKQLVHEVAEATGLKKPEAKKAVEATLAAIGTALAAKSTLAVPPLGKLRVAKASAGVMTLKLRLADASRAKGLALAEDGEDD